MNEGDNIDPLIDKMISFITIISDVFKSIKLGHESDIKNFYLFKKIGVEVNVSSSELLNFFEPNIKVYLLLGFEMLETLKSVCDLCNICKKKTYIGKMKKLIEVSRKLSIENQQF